jgi:hypothetical protein
MSNEKITYDISPENLSDYDYVVPNVLDIRKPVGTWDLGNFSFSVYRRPTDEQIKNTEEFFGWKWVDYE